MQVALILDAKSGGERRASHRLRSSTPAVVRQQKLPNETIRIIDISPEGCRFKTRWPLTTGAQVWLGLPGLETWRATVVWMGDGEGGMKFDRPLHPLVAARFASEQ